MKKLKRIIADIYDSLTDEPRRIEQQFVWIYLILFFVALFMSFINCWTHNIPLMWATLLFSALCIGDILIAKTGRKGLKISSLLFSLEIIVLFTFFMITGMPDGFSAIWICLVPSSGMMLYRRRRGTALSALMLAILIFLLYTPMGNGLLQYAYTDTFKMRFPILYVAFFAISFFLETVRAKTYEKLQRTQDQYEYLYAHDALTGLLNRYGFNSCVNQVLNGKENGTVALLILDIDHFKNVNDRYGHLNGDAVLKQLSALLMQTAGDDTPICRWGGEEFAVLCTDGQRAKRLADEMLTAVAAMPVVLNAETIHITVSIGMAVAMDNQNTLDELLSTADACLFAAKDGGRNRVECRILS